MRKLLKRFSEPSTWAGLAALTIGAGQIGKINEAPEVAAMINNAGDALASGSGLNGIITLLAGLVAMFMREKGN